MFCPHPQPLIGLYRISARLNAAWGCLSNVEVERSRGFRWLLAVVGWSRKTRSDLHKRVLGAVGHPRRSSLRSRRDRDERPRWRATQAGRRQRATRTCAESFARSSAVGLEQNGAGLGNRSILSTCSINRSDAHPP